MRRQKPKKCSAEPLQSVSATTPLEAYKEIKELLVELAQWSRVAELNGELHARIASALALLSWSEDNAKRELELGEWLRRHNQ